MPTYNLLPVLLLLSQLPAFCQKKCTLHVTIEDTAVSKVYYGLLNDDCCVSNPDSVQPQNGQFSLSSPGTSFQVFNLWIPGTTWSEKIIVFLQPGLTEVRLNTKDWDRYTVTGDPLTIAYFNFEKEYEAAESQRNRSMIELQKDYRKTKNVDSAEARKLSVMYQHLLLNRNTEVGALIAYQHFADTHYNRDADSAYGLLTARARDSRFGKSLKSYIDLNSAKKTIDFSFTDINGQKLKLSDLKSRYTLIHFWASWYGPCRDSNPPLAELYRRTSRSQLEIVNISLDLSKADWVKAIETDSLPGYHSSELNGFDNSVAMKYSVRAIPSSFLVDNKGNIVLINPDLVRFIEETIKH